MELKFKFVSDPNKTVYTYTFDKYTVTNNLVLTKKGCDDIKLCPSQVNGYGTLILPTCYALGAETITMETSVPIIDWSISK